MKSPIFRPAAAADVEDAYRWYETQQIGLGDGFLDGVRAALEAIEAAPESYAVVHRDTRRALLRRFPYGLYYRIIANQVIVVACFHAKRDPRRWRVRR